MNPPLTERNEQMRHQRLVLRWTLQQIADHWHIRRQRVGQILGPTGRFSKQKASDTCTTTQPDNS